MKNNKQPQLDERVLDQLAPLLDGETASADTRALAEHDDVRDLLHELAPTPRAIRTAADDYAFVPQELPGDLLHGLVDRVAGETKPAPLRVAEQQTPATPANPASENGAEKRVPIAVWLAAAALPLGAYLASRAGHGAIVPPPRQTSGAVVEIVEGTVELFDSGRWRTLASEDSLPTDARVRTSPRARARLLLADASTVVVNQSSLVQVSAARCTVQEGDAYFDVRTREASPFTVATDFGEFAVLGTAFSISKTQSGAVVRVEHGHVRMKPLEREALDVFAGEEGVIENNGAAHVFATELVRTSWAEFETPIRDQESSEVPLAGIGSLRAKRPGQTAEREHALRIATQTVRVDIQGNIARTEIEQTFQNDQAQELEGIYKFPLPPDAQIARLALDVDGVMQDGEVVEKDRADRIWRGVIRNATPVAQRQRNEEYVWVPGPWRDPALLTWQRGGNFELRIFPIPARGQRRVIIAYTQVLPRNGTGRRYTYPMAHSADASTAIGDFRVELHADGARNVRTTGYPLVQSNDAFRFGTSSFLPYGDLAVEFETENDAHELTSWTSRTALLAQVTAQVETHRGGGALVPEDVVEQQRLAADTRPYVAIAIRPELPRATERVATDYVFAVDSSQSMVGERYRRATLVVREMVRRLDRGDRFALLACDIQCRLRAHLAAPDSTEFSRAEIALAAVEPGGASDVGRALREAVNVVHSGERRIHVVYIGDGSPSIGYRTPSTLIGHVQNLRRQHPNLMISTIGIGDDSDNTILEGVAHAGGGRHTAYIPGQSVGDVALAGLGASYGTLLTDVSILLPDGLSDAAPTQFSAMRAGEELVMAARMNADNVAGDVVLTGKIAGVPFERRYPVSLRAEDGNRFVTRLWAQAQIRALERQDAIGQRARIVALGKAFHLVSRHTSMLVLESAAMYRAFGVEQTVAQDPGIDNVVADNSDAESEAAEVSLSAALDDAPGDAPSPDDRDSRNESDAVSAEEVLEGALVDSRPGFGGLGARPAGGGAGTGSGYGVGSASRHRESASSEAPSAAPTEAPPRNLPEPQRAAAPVTTTPRSNNNNGRFVEDALRQQQAARSVAPTQPPLGQWMRREWYTTAQVVAPRGPTSSEQAQASTAIYSLEQNPDSPEAHRVAVRWLSRIGNLPRALEVVRAWLVRNPLDTEALVWKADLLARNGAHTEALRTLSGVLDINSNDQALQLRVRDAFTRGHDWQSACSVRQTVAEAAVARNQTEPRFSTYRTGVPELQYLDVCSEEGGMRALQELANSVNQERQRRYLLDSITVEGLAPAAGGQLAIETVAPLNASRVSIITPDGTRLSSMGGRSGILFDDQKLGLRTLRAGTYIVEVSREGQSWGADGSIRIRALDARGSFRARGIGQQNEVARIVVRRESRLVPAWR